MNRNRALEILRNLPARRVALADVLDRLRLSNQLPVLNDRGLLQVPVEERPTMSGSDIGASIGPLLHYTTQWASQQIRRSGWIGIEGSGVWLTPTAYAGWQAAAELGLTRPCDTCLIVDVAGLGDSSFYGPGVADPSDKFEEVWPGGGLAFYFPHRISARHILHEVECGRDLGHKLTDAS